MHKANSSCNSKKWKWESNWVMAIGMLTMINEEHEISLRYYLELMVI